MKNKNLKFEKPIYVTRPLIPNTKKFIKKAEEIFQSQYLTNKGPQFKKFKKNLQNYLQRENVSLFCNGTQALELGIQAMDLEGEVITTPFTFVASTHSITRNGLKPVFCDIEKETYTLDPDKIEDCITDKTSAILAVHVYGYPCKIEEIEKIAKNHNLKIIYDAAHAFGVKYKDKFIHEYGDLTMYSFHATKSFNTFEGGALVFKNSKLKEKLELLKNFGIKNEDEILTIGTNAKMNEIQAAMGLILLKIFEKEIEKRRKITLQYREKLKEISGITFLTENKNIKHNYQYFPILVNKEKYGIDRNQLYDKLKKYNVFSRKYFYPLCSNINCYKDLPSAKKANLPVANKVANEILCLPIYGNLNNESVKKISNIIKYL